MRLPLLNFTSRSINITKLLKLISTQVRGELGVAALAAAIPTGLLSFDSLLVLTPTNGGDLPMLSAWQESTYLISHVTRFDVVGCETALLYWSLPRSGGLSLLVVLRWSACGMSCICFTG